MKTNAPKPMAYTITRWWKTSDNCGSGRSFTVHSFRHALQLGKHHMLKGFGAYFSIEPIYGPTA